MKRSIQVAAALAAATVLSSAPALAQAPPVGNASDEEAAVLAALDEYMLAISANDLRAMEKIQTVDGMTYRAKANANGTWEIVGHPNSYWIAPSMDDGRTYRERYWSPIVHIRGPIAVVWAPYEFWINGETTHCGIDVMDFIKTDGVWHESNSMWTVEPDACDELRPSDSSFIRPRE